MIYGWLALLALAVLAPVLVLLRGSRLASFRGARQLALDLHATQLRELDRDLAERRILPEEHRVAVLEVQRRMLAAGSAAEAAPREGARWPVLAASVAIPLAAAGLYAASGAHPTLPSSDHSAAGRQAEEAALVDVLRQRLAQMDPSSEQARQGYLLLGRAEVARGRFGPAAEAFRMALTGKFDPLVALNAAEASVRAEGGVSESTATLYRRALAAEPEAPWRAAVEQRLAEKRLSRPDTSR